MVNLPNAEEPIDQVDDTLANLKVRRAERLVVVVGFDGSECAYRALDASALLIADRTGSVEIVFVAHVASFAEMSTDALSESLKAFDSSELEFAVAVRDRLADVDFRWRFQRRDGSVAHELISVADEFSREYGEGSQVVIVVGSAVHSFHQFVGSVPVALVRHATYPIVVVP
jgi:nucleotide-binding universal stress UspA family protein